MISELTMISALECKCGVGDGDVTNTAVSVAGDIPIDSETPTMTL